MNLKSFIAQRRGAAVELAAGVGVNPVLIRQWANGSRPTPIEHCAAIEHHTGRKVMRWDLRPEDWRRIWPELADDPDASQAPQAANDGGVHSEAA